MECRGPSEGFRQARVLRGVPEIGSILEHFPCVSLRSGMLLGFRAAGSAPAGPRLSAASRPATQLPT